MSWLLVAAIGTAGVDQQTFLAVPAEPGDDPPEPPAMLAAGWTDSLVEDGSWPSIQDRSVGQLVLYYETAAEASWITSTTPISLRLHRPFDGPVVSSIVGRCGEPVIQPVDDGVEVTIAIVDHLADLDEHTRGDEDYPIETITERLERMFDDAGLPPPPEPEPLPGDFFMAFPLVARDKAPASLLSLAQEAIGSGLYSSIDYLPPPSSPDDVYPGNLGLYELRPNIDESVWALDPDTPWIQVPLPRVSTVTGATIPASAIRFGGSWSRRKFSDVNTVHIITGQAVVARVNNREAGEPRVIMRRPSQVSNTENARALGRYLLPDAIYFPTWEMEAFDVDLDRTDDDYWPGTVRAAINVDGLQPRHTPGGTDSWIGVLTQISTSIAAGQLRARVTLSARPTDLGVIFDGGRPESTSWDIDLDGLYPDTTTWDIDPLDLGGSS